MKKLLFTLALVIGFGVMSIQAQETKVKPVVTPADRAHNVVHPHNKVAHGNKYKHKTAAGRKHTVVVKKANAEAMEPKKKTKNQN